MLLVSMQWGEGGLPPRLRYAPKIFARKGNGDVAVFNYVNVTRSFTIDLTDAVGFEPSGGTAICNINAHQHFEFSIGNDEIMQKLPLKSVLFIQKVPSILHIAVPTPFSSLYSSRAIKCKTPIYTRHVCPFDCTHVRVSLRSASCI